MRIFFISLLLLFSISLSNIYYCNQRRRLFERAAIYRRDIVSLILVMVGILQIPLAICLGILNWKVLIIVYIFFIFTRVYINLIFERLFIFPVYLFLLKIAEHKNHNQREK